MLDLTRPYSAGLQHKQVEIYVVLTSSENDPVAFLPCWLPLIVLTALQSISLIP